MVSLCRVYIWLRYCSSFFTSHHTRANYSLQIALNGPKEQAVATIHDFKEIFLAPWFLVWGSLCLATAFALIFFAAPKWGERTMLIYIVICSLFGGLSVSCIQGLGMSILTTYVTCSFLIDENDSNNLVEYAVKISSRTGLFTS